MNAKTNLSSLLQRLYRAKQASDGFDSSMPDDPSGDGLMDPQTGSQYEQYEDDYENTDTLANMDEDTSESMEEDNEQENSLGTYELSTSTSEEQSAKGEYEDQLEDPGTTMPAEAGQEKFSSAMNCTLEQNIAVFRKCAESLWQTRQAQQNVIKQAAAYVSKVAPAIGSFTKYAEDLGASPEETNEMAAIEAIAEEEPELLEALADASPEELEEIMDVANAIEADSAPAEDVAVEEKLASFQFTKRALDEGASPDEANEVAAIEALVQEEPELVEALSEASPEELAELADIATAIEEGGADESAITPEEQVDLEKQSFFAQRPANQQLLASMTTEQLQKAAESIDEAIDRAENGTLSEEEIQEIINDEETPEAVKDEDDLEEKDSCSGRKKKASALSAEDLYRYSNSSDLYALSLQKRAEEEAAAYESLSPEEKAMIDSASDEELQQAAEQGEAAQEDPELLDSMLSGEAPAEESTEDSEPTEEEALNELASAMEEEGITPEALAEASKEAYYRGDKSAYQDYNTACKVAAFIRSGRHTPGPAKTEKAARVRHFSHNYLKEVMPQR